MGEATADLAAIHNRVLGYASKLAEALQDLDDAGGVRALRGAVRPATADRLARQLREARAAIDEQLRGIGAWPRA